MQQPNLEFLPLDLLKKEHVECMYRVRTDPEVVNSLTGVPPCDFNHHLHYLQNVKNKKFFILKRDHICCGYAQATFLTHAIELGWAIHPDFWGKGLGTFGVVSLVKEMLPNSLPLILFVKKTNDRAVRLYLKNGFRKSQETTDGSHWEMVYHAAT